jgi:hypothetical protein
MYKPNGEEPMTKHDEQRCREAVAERLAERTRETPSADALRSAFYSALFHSPATREEAVSGAVLIHQQ